MRSFETVLTVVLAVSPSIVRCDGLVKQGMEAESVIRRHSIPGNVNLHEVFENWFSTVEVTKDFGLRFQLKKSNTDNVKVSTGSGAARKVGAGAEVVVPPGVRKSFWCPGCCLDVSVGVEAQDCARRGWTTNSMRNCIVRFTQANELGVDDRGDTFILSLDLRKAFHVESCREVPYVMPFVCVGEDMEQSEYDAKEYVNQLVKSVAWMTNRYLQAFSPVKPGVVYKLDNGQAGMIDMDYVVFDGCGRLLACVNYMSRNVGSCQSLTIWRLEPEDMQVMVLGITGNSAGPLEKLAGRIVTRDDDLQHKIAFATGTLGLLHMSPVDFPGISLGK